MVRLAVLLAAARCARALRVAPRMSVVRSASTGDEEAWCQVDVPCSLLRRCEKAVLGSAPKNKAEAARVRAYLADALQLGLGVVERATATSEAAAIAGEFETLLRRLESWDTSTREKLTRTWTESEARQAATLEKYLGDRGALEASVTKLRQELTDARVATSIPATTATAVAGAVEALVRDVKRAVDASDEASELSKFLRSSRADVAQLRVDLERAQRRFSEELRAEIAALVRPGEAAEANAKGRGFELEVGDALRRLASAAGDGVVDTAAVTQRGSLAKVGDLVVDFGLGDRAPRLAVEVKAGAFSFGGSRSLEKQIRDAMAGRDAHVGLGVVRAVNLPKKLSWYTALRDDVVIVAFEPDLEHGHVALDCAYKVLRATAFAKKLGANDDRTNNATDPRQAVRLAAQANTAAKAVADRAADILANLDRLKRMKKNSTDVINMLTVLRQDLDNLDRDIRDALRDLDRDIQPLYDLRPADPLS